MQNYILSQREIKTYWEKSEKTSLVDRLSFLHAKQLLMELFFEKLQTYANLLLGMMEANYNPARFVNPCPPVFIRAGMSIQKPVGSHLDKIRAIVLKIWSYRNFKEHGLIVKLRASKLQADRRKLTGSVVLGFVLIAIFCLKQWITFIVFVPIRSCVHLSLKKL